MASQDLEMEDLFDTGLGDGYDDDDVGAGAPMPGLDAEAEEAPMGAAGSDEEGAGDDEEGGDMLAKLRAMKRGAAKKRVMRPQPKLDAQRLKSERGLPALSKMFENVKFTGRGHEAHDLKLLMSRLEHWGHRLFPKMTFDELIARLEKLGSKKDVQTCIKRIRLDMPVLDEDFVSAERQEEDVMEGEGGPGADQEEDVDAEEAYDEMIRQEREALERRKQEQEGTTGTPARVDGADSSVTIAPPQTPHTAPPTPANGLTPAQRERLEQNKLRALEKRAAKLGVLVSALMPQISSASRSVPEPSQTTGSGPEVNPGHTAVSEISQLTASRSESHDVTSQNTTIQENVDSGSKSAVSEGQSPIDKTNEEGTENLHLYLSESEVSHQGVSHDKSAGHSRESNPESNNKPKAENECESDVNMESESDIDRAVGNGGSDAVQGAVTGGEQATVMEGCESGLGEGGGGGSKEAGESKEGGDRDGEGGVGDGQSVEVGVVDGQREGGVGEGRVGERGVGDGQRNKRWLGEGEVVERGLVEGGVGETGSDNTQESEVLCLHLSDTTNTTQEDIEPGPEHI